MPAYIDSAVAVVGFSCHRLAGLGRFCACDLLPPLLDTVRADGFLVPGKPGCLVMFRTASVAAGYTLTVSHRREPGHEAFLVVERLKLRNKAHGYLLCKRNGG